MIDATVRAPVSVELPRASCSREALTDGGSADLAVTIDAGLVFGELGADGWDVVGAGCELTAGVWAGGSGCEVVAGAGEETCDRTDDVGLDGAGVVVVEAANTFGCP